LLHDTYCQYEVSFGYDNISKIIANHESLKNICSDNTDSPKILYIKPIAETLEKYKKSKCYDELDKDDNSRNKRKRLIIDAMNQYQDVKNSIEEEGKSQIKSIVSPFCKHIK